MPMRFGAPSVCTCAHRPFGGPFGRTDGVYGERALGGNGPSEEGLSHKKEPEPGMWRALYISQPRLRLQHWLSEAPSAWHTWTSKRDLLQQFGKVPVRYLRDQRARVGTGVLIDCWVLRALHVCLWMWVVCFGVMVAEVAQERYAALAARSPRLSLHIPFLRGLRGGAETHRNHSATR